MKHENHFLLILLSSLLFQLVKAPHAANVAESQAEGSNVGNVVEPQLEAPSVESQEPELTLDTIAEISNVGNIGETSQTKTPNEENPDELQEEKAPDVENVAQIQTRIYAKQYRIYISLFNEGDKPIFIGRIKIKFICFEETDVLVMNAKNMDITEYQVGVSYETQNKLIPREIVKIRRTYFANNRPDIFVVELTETLKKGVIYYVSSIVTSDRHLEHPEVREQIVYNYTNDWKNHEMMELVTRIGPNKASLLFPCFHETNVKSRFMISVTHPAENMVTLSNWPLSKRKDFIGKFPDHVSYEFEDTAPITPSGVSFAVISFKSTDLFDPPTDKVKPPVRIWADEKLIGFMTEAKKVATKALKFYLDYFSMPLYSRKLDIIALPKIHKGDTEKFGLISLEESSLVYYEVDDQKHFDITRDLCFAISGQWIGTSVTMSDLSQNYFHHAISYFLEKICINEVNSHPGFDFYNLRDLITFNRTLMPDYEPKLYSEFDSVFNNKLPTGETQKALHLIQMLVFILSERTLKESLSIYLKEFEHSFANLDKLWEILTTHGRIIKSSDKKISVKDIMDVWIKENEFPLLRVKVDYSGKTVTMSQEPFKFLGEKKEEVKETCWNIRLSYASKTGLKFVGDEKPLPDWLTCKKSETFEVDVDPEEWIVVNSQLNVLSHTYFEGRNWELIQKTLLNPETFLDIDPPTRAHLGLDMFALAEAGVVSYERVFHTMKYLKHEISELCWIVALTEFDKIYSYLLGTTTGLLKQFQNYVQEILKPVFNSVSSHKTSEEWIRESFDQPSIVREASGDISDTESKKLSDQPSVSGKIKSNERLGEDKKFRKLFDEPVKIDEIRSNDRLQMEFTKLFVRSACKFGVSECIDQSKALYERWRTSIENKDPVIKEIPIEFRDVVLCQTLRTSSKDVWDHHWGKFAKIKGSKENDIILKGLGCFENDIDSLNKYLEDTLEKTYQGNNLKAFASLSSTVVGYYVMKDFLTTKFWKLKFHVENTNSPDREPIKLESYFAELFNVTTKKEDKDELEKFMMEVEKHIDLSDEFLQKSIKKANKNILWLDTYKETWSELLKDYDGSTNNQVL